MKIQGINMQQSNANQNFQARLKLLSQKTIQEYNRASKEFPYHFEQQIETLGNFKPEENIVIGAQCHFASTDLQGYLFNNSSTEKTVSVESQNFLTALMSLMGDAKYSSFWRK